MRWGLIAFTLVAALCVLIAMVRLGNRITLTTVALALILGGALGNVHDRIVYGSVVDFIEVHIFSYHWPDFNRGRLFDRDRRLPAVSGFAAAAEKIQFLTAARPFAVILA